MAHTKNISRLGMIGLALFVSMAGSALAQSPNYPPNKPGFPLTLSGGKQVSYTQPVVTDLGLSGGVKSIIFGTVDGKLHVIYRNGSGVWGEAPGFPVQVSPVTSCPTACIAASPAVGVLGGSLAIVVPYGDPASYGPGGVKAYRTNGALLWQRVSGDRLEVGPDGQPDPVLGSAAIGDVNGDGQNEVVWGSTDYFVYVVNGANGTNLPGWPQFMRDTVRSSPALHDIDGDGRPEIIIGIDTHPEGAPYNTPAGGCVHVMRYDSTQSCPTSDPWQCGPSLNTPGFPVCVDQAVESSPSVGDIDGDGRPEIVHGTGTFYPLLPDTTPRSPRIYAWKCDGTAPPGWPVAIQGQSPVSPALANLDGDAALEVVVSADNTLGSSTFHVYGFKGNGTRIFETEPRNFFGAALSSASPVVADVLGTTTPEILVASSTSVAILSSVGTLLTDDGSHAAGKFAPYTDTALSGVTVADFGDGRPLGVVAISGTPFSANPPDTKIWVWEPVARTSATPPWGHFRQGPTRSGVAPGAPSCKGYEPCVANTAARRLFTLPPCRLVDTRLTSGVPYGAPPLSSGGYRDFAVHGACSIPASATAVSVNITVTSPSGSGFLRFSPDCQMPNASIVNFRPGQTRANNAILGIDGASGILTANAFIDAGGSVQLLIDVNGYFQ